MGVECQRLLLRDAENVNQELQPKSDHSLADSCCSVTRGFKKRRISQAIAMWNCVIIGVIYLIKLICIGEHNIRIFCLHWIGRLKDKFEVRILQCIAVHFTYIHDLFYYGSEHLKTVVD